MIAPDLTCDHGLPALAVSENTAGTRLLYLVGDLGPGGLQRQLLYLLGTMDRQRYKPVLVVWSYRQEDVFVPEFHRLGISIYPLPAHLSPLKKLIMLRGIVNTLRPEVVHSYSFYTNIVAQWSALGLPCTRIGSIRNDFLHELKSGKVLGRLSARWPRTQICNSEAASQSIEASEKLFQPQYHYFVRNGLNVENFFVKEELPRFPRLLAVGRLSPEKRWDRLLKAVGSLQQRGIEFELSVVGIGPLWVQLQAQVRALDLQKRVTFLGHRKDIPALLAESTCLVNTAEHEGCPNIVMEAMACGRAVVATDAGDVGLLVEDERTGFVIPQNDQDLLVERLQTLIQDFALCHRIGSAGRIKAENEFAMERLVSETFDVYRREGWRG